MLWFEALDGSIDFIGLGQSSRWTAPLDVEREKANTKQARKTFELIFDRSLGGVVATWTHEDKPHRVVVFASFLKRMELEP